SGGGQDVPYWQIWQALARALWMKGAVLAFGGDPGRGDLIQRLEEVRQELPMPLSTTPKTPLRLVLFPPSEQAAQGVLTVIPTDSSVQVVANPVRKGDGDSDILSRKHELFTMRWRMTCRCSARILVGGGVQDYAGRMPGIFEEGMLALALGQPVYILG